MNDKFERQFRRIEVQLTKEGRSLKELTLAKIVRCEGERRAMNADQVFSLVIRRRRNAPRWLEVGSAVPSRAGWAAHRILRSGGKPILQCQIGRVVTPA